MLFILRKSTGARMLKEIQDIDSFIWALKDRTGYDFSSYSLSAIKRRIVKILKDSQISFSDLLDRVNNDSLFSMEVAKKITVPTTELFRDPPLWIYLKERILAQSHPGNPLSIWHAGCSTGLEVYSMMILLHQMGLFESSFILASDLNPDAIKTAKRGLFNFFLTEVYSKNYNTVVNTGRTGKWIESTEYFNWDPSYNQILMKDFLRMKPQFEITNLLNDGNPVNRKFDIIFCRNVIFYLKKDMQARVLELFYNNLNDKGILILGLHEKIEDPMEKQFVKIGNAVYRKYTSSTL